MIQRQLPPWARADHPVLRYIVGLSSTPDRRPIYARRIFVVVTSVVIAVVGYAIASDFFVDDLFEKPISEALILMLFWPLFVMQIAVRLSAMAMTVGTIGEEKRRQTWDNLRTTTNGAALAIRARWSAVVFYRLRAPMIVMTLARLVLIGALLYDLTAFRGDYLSNLTVNITPEVPLPAAVLLLALVMTASLLLPFTATGFDAAVGMLVSTFVNQRVYVVMAQIALSAFRLGITFVLLLAVTEFREMGGVEAFTSDTTLWLLLFAFAALGDWGLTILHLGYFGQVVWAEVPYSIFIGVGLLVFVFVQTLITDGILALAVRRAERRE